jgi:hypothetical protein
MHSPGHVISIQVPVYLRLYGLSVVLGKIPAKCSIIFMIRISSAKQPLLAPVLDPLMYMDGMQTCVGFS